MTTVRRPTSGRGQGNDVAKLDAYNKASKTASVGNYMRTFARTKTGQVMTTWDDIDYLTVANIYLFAISDVTTAIDDATTPSAQMEAILDLAWVTHFTNANLKDLVATDEASWKLYFAFYFQIAAAIQIQYNLRCKLPAYTENDAVPGDYSNIPYFSQSSFDIFLASMKDFPAPKGVYELVDTFFTWMVQLTQEYERFTLRIPAMVFQPFNSLYDLEDLQDMRNELRSNLGGFKTHAQKYGLGLGSWRDPVPPVMKRTSDVDVIAYFNHSHFNYNDKNNATVVVNPDGGFMGADSSTNYTGVEYMFKDTPNESKIHVLAPWFGIYDGTHLPYGGLFKYVPATASEYYANFANCAQHGTNIGHAIMTSNVLKTILPLYKAYADGQSATFIRTINGTNFTAAQNIGGSEWCLAKENLLFMGLGRGFDETNNDLINFIGKIIT